MATEHFCLRWNNHQSTLISVFDNLLESGTLVDCTLAADGRYLKAHKVVLSACSPYLGMLLSQHYDKHPIIILKDVKYEELKAMLDYMYRGEVNISQEQLSTFLKAAETLQIKGLTDTGGDEGNGVQTNRPPSSNSTTSLPNEDPQSPVPPGEGRNSPTPKKRKRIKQSDESLDSENQVKVVSSDGSDRSVRDSVSISGMPSNPNPLSALKNVSFGSVKREPSETDGDGQISVDESGDSTMLSRPGPSNGSGSNNKGSPWVLSADSTGEEMQLTPGQDGEQEIIEESKPKNKLTQDEAVLKQPQKSHGKEDSAPSSDVEPCIVAAKEKQESIMSNLAIFKDNEEELIVPDLLENSDHPSDKSSECKDKGYVERIRVIQPEQLGLRSHHASQNLTSEAYMSSDEKDCFDANKIKKENVNEKNCHLIDITTSESSKDPLQTTQCTILKGVNKHQLAAKNFRNVSISTTEEKNYESPKNVPLLRSRVNAISSKSIQNIATKFRKILPVPNPPTNILSQTENEESQITTFNQTNTSQGVPYSFSFASPLQTSTSSTLSLQMQPQFTISPSTIQDGSLTQPTNVVQQATNTPTSQLNLAIQPQYTFSPSQFQTSTIQTLTNIVPQQSMNTQNVVVNRPPLFVAPKIIGTKDMSNQTISSPDNKKVPVAYVGTRAGYVRYRGRGRPPIRMIGIGRSAPTRSAPTPILAPATRLPPAARLATTATLQKILPKPESTVTSDHLQTLRTVRESTEFIITSMKNSNNN